MWVEIGAAAGRADVVAHGKSLLALAPRIHDAMQTSLRKTTVETGNPAAPRCVPTSADAATACQQSTAFRAYPEMLYSGALTARQVDDIYLDQQMGNKSDAPTRPMTLGCVGYNNKQTTYTQYGMGYGLLGADMIERCARRHRADTPRSRRDTPRDPPPYLAGTCFTGSPCRSTRTRAARGRRPKRHAPAPDPDAWPSRSPPTPPSVPCCGVLPGAP